MPEYKLPDVGEGLTEAEIVTWKVKVGDVIAINDIVVEIETAKSLVELPSPYAGTVTALLVAEGETVDVGTPIIAIGDALGAGRGAGRRTRGPRRDRPVQPRRQRWRRGREPGRPQQGRARGDAPARARRTSPAAAAAEQSTPRAGRRVVRARRGVRPRRSSRPTSRPCRPTRPPRSRPAASNGDVRALAKPPVRKLAKDLGVDITLARRLRRGRGRHARGRAGRGSDAGLETGAGAPSSTSGGAPSSTDGGSGASRSRASAR